MAQIQDFRKQSGTPTTPDTSSVVGLYVDSNGSFISLDSAGVKKQVGGQITGGLPSSAIATGLGTVLTGVTYGTVSTNRPALGTPDFWMPVFSGANVFAVPAYRLV